MLDHVIITVRNLDRSIAFYEAALEPLGIVHALDYDGKNGPEGHPDLKGFGRDGRVFFWLRHGDADARTAHIGFVARSEAEVNCVLRGSDGERARADNGKPGARLYYDPRLLCRERFRSRRLQSRGGLQELATPPIIELQNLKEPRPVPMPKLSPDGKYGGSGCRVRC